MRVAVLSGGRSSEHEVSLRSGEAVAAGLREAGHETASVVIGRDGSWTLDGEAVSIAPGEGLVGADVVFPALHGPYGEDGVTQGTLETAGVPYVGSNVLGSAVCMDKLTLKRLCAGWGIAQVDFVQAFTDGWREKALALAMPLWVKPSRLGSSLGITKVETPGELDSAVEHAASFDPRVIVEANADGREIECSVLGNDQPETSLPGEVVAEADWYDFEAKYGEGGMSLSVPATIDEDVEAELRGTAVEVFVLAGCSGLARCDFFVGPGDAILLNELNTMPGFTETSVYAKLWTASGLPYPELCDRLVRLAIERYREDSRHGF